MLSFMTEFTRMLALSLNLIHHISHSVRQPSDARTGVGQQRLTRRAAVVDWKGLSAVHFI